MNLAIIPARGGSKRIKKKNSKSFFGEPMISRAIKTCFDSNLFSKVVVSTDDDQIKKLSEKSGASVPFIRPKNLSDDITPTVPVVRHAIEYCENNLGWNIENVCCVYPCTPFLMPADLVEGFNRLNTSSSDFIFPVAEYSSSIFRSLKVDGKYKATPTFQENILKRTQDLDKAYYDLGQFYWGKNFLWKSSDKIHMAASVIIIPSNRAIDIDTEEDWNKAESLFRVLMNDKKK